MRGCSGRGEEGKRERGVGRGWRREEGTRIQLVGLVSHSTRQRGQSLALSYSFPSYSAPSLVLPSPPSLVEESNDCRPPRRSRPPHSLPLLSRILTRLFLSLVPSHHSLLPSLSSSLKLTRTQHPPLPSLSSHSAQPLLRPSLSLTPPPSLPLPPTHHHHPLKLPPR